MCPDPIKAMNISIHAPRTGSDLRRSAAMRSNSYFNPRSPHGERQARYRGIP